MRQRSMIRHPSNSSRIGVYPHIPKPQLAIGSPARILRGRHQDIRGRIVSSVWDTERQTWLYFLRSGPVGLGEYAADELWL